MSPRARATVAGSDPASTTAAAEALLPAADIAVLDDLGLVWTVEMVASVVTIIISSYQLPPGFDRLASDLLLRLPASWPDGVPDMFWFDPAIKIAATGAEAPATEHREAYCGRSWQRWSRHIQNGWKPGVDGLRNFLVIVDRELAKAVA